MRVERHWKVTELKQQVCEENKNQVALKISAKTDFYLLFQQGRQKTEGKCRGIIKSEYHGSLVQSTSTRVKLQRMFFLTCAVRMS